MAVVAGLATERPLTPLGQFRNTFIIAVDDELHTVTVGPDPTTPESAELREAQVRWSTHYSAKGFDVDRGPR